MAAVVLFALSAFRSAGHAAAIPEEIKQAVAFVFVPDGNGQATAAGTAFFIGVTDEANTETTHVYLVTARHVLRNAKNEDLDRIWVRLNKRTNGADMILIPLRGPQAAPVFTHRDPDVDLAVIPFLPSQEQYRFKVIPEKMLVTRELFLKRNIREGDEVFFLGLFTPFVGVQRNYPVVRFGRIALMSDEKIPWKSSSTRTAMMELYLLEVQSFGGNSGAPVFFEFGGTREPGKIVLGGAEILLGGVMQGTFLQGNEIQMIERRQVPTAFENLGIAAVVPAHKLHELLYEPAIRARRIKPH